jgi:hypothetical protein
MGLEELSRGYSGIAAPAEKLKKKWWQFWK